MCVYVDCKKSMFIIGMYICMHVCIRHMHVGMCFVRYIYRSEISIYLYIYICINMYVYIQYYRMVSIKHHLEDTSFKAVVREGSSSSQQ